jgi:DNA-binding transcriptional regulator YhcF (GntR family)
MIPSRLNRTSLTEQTAELIREGLRTGRWRTRMPGQGALAKEFGVSATTVYCALRLLMEEGVLVADGNGRGALITAEASQGVPGKAAGRTLRVALLSMVPVNDMYPGHYFDLARLARDLEHDGHDATLVGFSKDKRLGKTGNLAKLYRETVADVWLIYQGTEEVLEWFVRKGATALGMGGA